MWLDVGTPTRGFPGLGAVGGAIMGVACGAGVGTAGGDPAVGKEVGVGTGWE